ncbi:hypothetical protein RB195_003357 [Necator americanus]|uniref:Uncharacterized protein n=1 Tax=Necator americanus TaxID=51031 RepID=A0ABR1DN93_NECAM
MLQLVEAVEAEADAAALQRMDGPTGERTDVETNGLHKSQNPVSSRRVMRSSHAHTHCKRRTANAIASPATRLFSPPV